MNSPPAAVVQSPSNDERYVGDEETIDELMDAIDDPDCRAILEATVTKARSASELSEACDLPLSTTYRKVDKLTDVGLLEEGLRLCSSGKHTNEYGLAVESIQLTVDPNDGLELEIMPKSDDSHTKSLLAAGD
jgi:DNA-binding transcriptional ArsR family regulator